jgi:uncharacterized protein YceK
MKKLLIILTLSLLAAGCNTATNNNQSSTSQSTQAEADLMQHQADCNNWGQIILKNNVFTTVSPQVSTHYNTSLEKCYVEVKSQNYFASTGDTSLADQIFDAEKGNVILDLTSSVIANIPVNTAFDRRPVNGTKSEVKITLDQFTALRNQYMNN